ncbi:MAG: hypothetical protein ACYTGB_12530 [Planctomycetota bacterium]|jgi:CheY-like chemotaxis protein
MAELPRRTVLLTALCGLTLLAGGVRAAENGGSKDPNTLWAQGVEFFDRGEYTKAREKLDALVDLVDENVAERLVKRAGIPAMVRMMSSPDLGRTPKIIWELYSKYSRRKMRDQETIIKYVRIAVDEKAHEVKRQEALHQLRRIGQFAVPELAKHLSDRSSERRALVRIALSYIGRRGTLAMAKLTDTGNDLFKETLVLAISDIKPADMRAVPALKRLYDNPKTNVTLKEKVAYALHKITGQSANDMASFEDYYYLQANRFYMELTGVPEEAFDADGVIWEVKEGKLVYRNVPIYSWNEEVAEDFVHDCLANSPEYDRIFPLLLSVELAQREEVEAIKDAMKVLGPPPTMTDTGKKVLGERDALLVDTKLLAEACGPRYLYRAVGKALRDDRPRVAAAAIDLLPLVDPYGGMLPPVEKVLLDKRGRPVKRRPKPKPKRRRGEPEPVPGPGLVTAAESAPKHEGQPLVDALSAKNDGVRFSAAIALAKMDPVKKFPDASKVVSSLADAISRAGPLQILIVEEVDDEFKRLNAEIQKFGWGVSRAKNGREAMNMAKSFPPKDLILLSTKLKVNLPAKTEGAPPKGGEKAPEGEKPAEVVTTEPPKQEGVLERLRKDRRASLIPVALLVKKEEMEADLAKFGRMPAIPRNLSGKDLKDELIKALGKTGPGITKQKREDMAARAARGLLEIDPLRTQFKVADCSAACQKALFNRPDKVRNPCIRALGLFKVQAAAKDLVKLFTNPDNKDNVTLRANCLYALGEADPVPNKALFLKAVLEEKEFVLRDEASTAVGKAHADKPDAKALTEFQRKCRLIRTNEGGDGRPEMHKPKAAAAPAADE